MIKIDKLYGTREMINSQANTWVENHHQAIIKKVETGGNCIEESKWMIVYYEE